MSFCLHFLSLALSLSLSFLDSVTMGYIMGFNSAALGLAGASLNGLEGSTPAVFSAPGMVTFALALGPAFLPSILINSTGWANPHIEESYHHIITYLHPKLGITYNPLLKHTSDRQTSIYT